MSPKKKTAKSFGLDRSNDVFHASLSNLKAEDIPVLAERKKNSRAVRKKISSAIEYAIIAICAAAFIVCTVLIVKNLSDKERGDEVYNEAASSLIPVTLGQSAGSEDKPAPPMQSIYDRINSVYGGGEGPDDGGEYDLDLSSIKASLSSLRETNSDVIGWIYVEDSRINYPLMQSSNGNDEYYLTHAYNGEYLAVGSIYLTYFCDKRLDKNYNSLIYGHNVVNGSMFHDVTKFLDKDFFDSKLVYIYTLDGAYIYKPFSIYETRSDYNYIQTSFSSEEEFFDFANRVAANSEVPSSVQFSPGDTMLTLSTCTNGGVMGVGRYAFHAKLIAFVE